MIIRRGGPVMAEIDVADRRRWLDSTPVMADGRVFLSPMESDELHCLDARSGSLLLQFVQAVIQHFFEGSVVDSISGIHHFIMSSCLLQYCCDFLLLNLSSSNVV